MIDTHVPLDKFAVFIFATNERTISLCKYCYDRLGFDNVFLLQRSDGFLEKLISFVDSAIESKFDYFIRDDADVLVFDGLRSLINTSLEADVQIAEGLYFDRFMNKFRYGSAHFYSRKSLRRVQYQLTKIGQNQKKPEGYLFEINEDVVGMFDIFVSLHEFEQFPSKVCNSYLNRIFRGHESWYESAYLNSLPASYLAAIKEAAETAKKMRTKNIEKESMNYLDFSHLDHATKQIDDSEVCKLYRYYKDLYVLKQREFNDQFPLSLA